MITERAIINALIIGASLLLAPFIVSETLTVNYLPALFFGGLGGLIFAFFFLKERLCMCPVFGSAIAGSFNIMGLPIQATHIICALVILYYITGYVLIRQKRVKLGKGVFFWPILIVTLIIFYHNHDFKVGALGGDTEGAKPALLIYLVFIAYFCSINVPTPSVSFISKIPLYYLFWSLVSSIPYLLTTVFPGLAPYLYMINTSVNVEAYVDTLASSNATGPLNKLAAFGAIGMALQVYLLCHYPIGTWLRPERWWVAGLSFVCLVLEASSGYRNDIFSFLVLTMVGAWCYHSWRSLVMPAAVFIGLLVLLISSSNNLIHIPVRALPLIAQRTLSFIPADWDQDAIASAKASNDFRKNIEDVYLEEYANRSPVLGNGFTIDKKEFDYYSDVLRTGGGMDASYVEAKSFIEGKMFHTGWISVYDNVGIVGTLAFIILGLNEIRFVARFISGPNANRKSALYPLYVWMQCNLVTGMISYFAVFGSFPDTFTSMIISGMVLSHLSDIANAREVATVLPEQKKSVEFSGLGGARYGY